MRSGVEHALKPTGYTLRHLATIGHLRREPGLFYSELGRRAGNTAQSAQATVRQLEQRGAVERRTEAGRGRTAELHVTEDGMRLPAAGQDAYASADAGLQSALGPDACRPPRSCSGPHSRSSPSSSHRPRLRRLASVKGSAMPSCHASAFPPRPGPRSLALPQG
ncbi:MarR family winged helix-turn-helix transcriptional regulator [Streptomyces sp. NPDC059101]|uniref:MarR family winged helix-turn-helix transcriptional regulator n=1 Tax=Streptomyces sp. NPDC059101 TaxID=3346728 RepID=UPI0036765431